MLESAGVNCPYCGTHFEATADPSGGTQDYIEDCPVCCRPIEFHLETDVEGELLSLILRREDD
jgi:endogenous inhibitor of DNA gyrase (YacG/DUF329 family)